MREREGKPGGGKGALISDKCFTLSTSNFHIVFLFEATRVDDVRLYGEYSPTVARYWGTGGARVPYVYAIQGTMIGRQDHNGPGGPGYNDEVMYTLTARDTHAVSASTVRRLTPTECERLQGFPDGWTEGQADAHRYKQMGNAVAVPVVSWIIGRVNGTDTPST